MLPKIASKASSLSLASKLEKNTEEFKDLTIRQCARSYPLELRVSPDSIIFVL
ncbi:MAG: hypothetical protein R3A13_10030 [Bdellovibrionota bacterium]